MSKGISVVMLGTFVAILPFLGFPQPWRIIFFVIAGLGVTLLGFLLRADHLHRETTPPQTSIQSDQNAARTMAARSPVRIRSTSGGTSRKLADIAAPAVASEEMKPD